jgi:hypothetical protein
MSVMATRVVYVTKDTRLIAQLRKHNLTYSGTCYRIIHFDYLTISTNLAIFVSTFIGPTLTVVFTRVTKSN